MNETDDNDTNIVTMEEIRAQASSPDEYSASISDADSIDLLIDEMNQACIPGLIGGALAQAFFARTESNDTDAEDATLIYDGEGNATPLAGTAFTVGESR